MILKTTLVMVLLGFIQPVFAKNPAPEWTQGAVWYYVIPERFRNINPHNDPLKLQIVGKDSKDWQVHPWASDWYKLQIWESRRNLKFDELVGLRRYGGDLLGVLEKLYYLKDLGINVIYLTPIFESPSILKYDVSSLHHIDDNLGFAHEGAWGRITPEKKKNDGEKKNSEEKVVPETEDPKTWALSKSDEVFIELLSKAHELGMKVVITSVFHYCGRDFWAFRDVLQKQQDSDYKDWFEVVGWDDPATPDTVEFDYKTWHDDKSLPLFRQDENGLSEPIRKYIYDSTRRWLDPNADGDPADGVDGWAVHEAEALPEPFLTDWIKLVKSIKPNAVTLADAHSAWFANGNKFDLTMTQTFTQLLQDFFVHQKYSVSKLFEELDGLRTGSDGLASEVHRLGDHRTDRIATIIRNSVNSDSTGVTPNNSHEYDPRKPDKQQREIQKALTFFQLTYPGAPMILYGDESGMWGGSQRDLIKPMLWREFVYERESYTTIRPDLKDGCDNVVDQELFQLYHQLNKIRRENPALQRGDFKVLLVDGERNVFAFTRQFEKNEVVVVFNNGDQQREIEIATGWQDDPKVKDGLNEKKYRFQNGKIKIELEKRTGAILIRQK